RMSWPVSLSMLGGTLMQFVDGWMVSFLGPETLSAQFIGGIVAFVPTSLALGTLTVINTFVSQNLGARRLQKCGEYVWAGALVALVYSILLGSLIFLANPLFELIGHAESIAAMEATYFSYMIGGMGLFLGSRVLEQFFFGIHRPGIVLMTSLIANAFNVGANYVLIFGKLGFPALGLAGAAIGTIVSNALLLLMLLAIFLHPRIHGRFATRRVRLMKLSECRELIRVGWPAGLQFCSDVMSWSVFVSVLVGVFGTLHIAASTAVQRFLSLSFMPAVGIGIATTALVGRYIGQGRPDLARRRAHAAVCIAMIYMGLCGVAFLLFRHQMVRFFMRVPVSGELTPEQLQTQIEQIVDIGGKIMICAAVFQLFDALGIVFVGGLRGAGDTFWPMLLTITMGWVFLIGGGIAMITNVPQLKSIGPWIVASVYVILLGLFMTWRFESGVWRKIDLLERQTASPDAAYQTSTSYGEEAH
ncbi:MAG: MATE family efflux transporter, partial [Planctomycetota bacterium]